MTMDLRLWIGRLPPVGARLPPWVLVAILRNTSKDKNLRGILWLTTNSRVRSILDLRWPGARQVTTRLIPPSAISALEIRAGKACLLQSC